ncbi:hypothetical protein FB567DRAFT_586104 [Paraphoma chrysanthemicola]|uniref:Rhodopsin domain-containing protein n=1 Tax=Paraphoma chrysanthemicola TaxID=798071 RepID=A0A8K0W520_9PLEO|nr:hypothetical protein FB567DRAFT_586104 [Paraphoma chrysanthemicola]
MIALLDGQFGWHDACALGAGIWAIPMNAMQFPLSAAGFGRDIWTIPPENVTRIQKLVWFTQIFYWPTTTLSRFAFLLLYLRIFPRESFRRWVFAAMGLNFFYWSFFQFSNLFQCHPMWMVWEGWDGEHEGSCWNINKLMLSAAGYTIVLDLIVMVLPLGELLQLQLSKKRKLGVMAIFVVGTFTWIISIIKIWAISSFAESMNTTWNDVPGDYWSVMEANVSVICVCMPALRRSAIRQWRRRGSQSNVGPEGADNTKEVECRQFSYEKKEIVQRPEFVLDDEDNALVADLCMLGRRWPGTGERNFSDADSISVAENPLGEQIVPGNERIEFHADGAKQALVRRGVNSKGVVDVSLRKPPALPSFEDDD